MSDRAAGRRTYGQYCPVAAGLDLIGDRWVLLICRELASGPRGFNEIKRALPGLASNLLTTRMRALVADGLAEQTDDGYALTERGRGVLPVLRAVARFGVAALPEPPEESLSAVRTARAFLLPWASVRDLPPLVVVRAPDGSAADLVVDESGARARERDAGEAVDPAVVRVDVDARNIAAVRRGEAAFAGSAQGPVEDVEVVLAALGLTSAR